MSTIIIETETNNVIDIKETLQSAQTQVQDFVVIPLVRFLLLPSSFLFFVHLFV